MIAFLILHYKTIEETRACVQSITELDSYSASNIYIEIVDNASNDGTGEALLNEYRCDKNIEVLILKESLGFSGGNNYGYSYLKHKKQPITQLIVCNNDIVFTQRDFLNRMKYIYEKTDYAVCGPNVYKYIDSRKIETSPMPSPAISKKSIQKLHDLRKWRIVQFEKGYCRENSMKDTARKIGLIKAIYEWYETPQTFLWYEFTHKFAMIPIKAIRFIEKIENKLELYHKHSWGGVQLHGSCLIFSQKYLKRCEKIFSPETYFYYEEVLLFLRCKRKKLKMIYAPDIEVWHKEGKSTATKFQNDATLRKAKMAYDAEQIAIDSFDM
jgi:GT2 family glycosyltransferase